MLTRDYWIGVAEGAAPGPVRDALAPQGDRPEDLGRTAMREDHVGDD
ncbi:hypothetical protein AB0465_35220 [Streptomyces griseoviridis]